MDELLRRCQVALDADAMLPQLPKADLQVLVATLKASSQLVSAIMEHPPSAYPPGVSDALLTLVEASQYLCECCGGPLSSSTCAGSDEPTKPDHQVS